MLITPVKENFIHTHFIDGEEFDDDGNIIASLAQFKKLNTFDQYYLALYYNWDNGTEVLNWIIDSKKCDKGTALLIFWAAEPDFYLEHDENTIPDYERDIFLLLKKIISKFQNNGFTRAILAYNPLSKVERLNRKKFKWPLPAIMEQSVRGIKPVYLSKIVNFLLDWSHRRKVNKRKKKRLKKVNAVDRDR